MVNSSVGGGGSKPGSNVGSPVFGGVGGNVALPGVGAMFGEMSLVCGSGGVLVGQQLGLGLSGVKRREDGDGERESKRREVEDCGGMDQELEREREQETSVGLDVNGEREEMGEVVKMEVDG